MTANAQCERCETYALSATSEERICEECKEVVRTALRTLLDEIEAQS